MTTWLEEQLQARLAMSQPMFVSSISFHEFEVTNGNRKEIVNLHSKTCTCQEFDVDQFPCVHAVASCGDQNISYYEICSRYYTSEALVKAYVESIYLIDQYMEWQLSDDIRNRVVLPPTICHEDGSPMTQGSINWRE